MHFVWFRVWPKALSDQTFERTSSSLWFIPLFGLKSCWNGWKGFQQIVHSCRPSSWNSLPHFFLKPLFHDRTWDAVRKQHANTMFLSKKIMFCSDRQLKISQHFRTQFESHLFNLWPEALKFLVFMFFLCHNGLKNVRKSCSEWFRLTLSYMVLMLLLLGAHGNLSYYIWNKKYCDKYRDLWWYRKVM